MKTTLENAPSPQSVMQVLRVLNEVPKIDGANLKGRLEASVAIWSTRALHVQIGLFAILLIFAAVHYVTPLSRSVANVALAIGILVQLSAVTSLLLQIGSGVAFAIHRYRWSGEIQAQECLLDHGNAMRLLKFDGPVLASADLWIEQKIKRLERGQVRFFGGSDKLAVIAVVSIAWTTWKELGLTLTSWQPTPLIFGVAFLVGLVLGGLSVARSVESLWYQKDVLQLAQALKCAAESSAAPCDATMMLRNEPNVIAVPANTRDARANGHQAALRTPVLNEILSPRH
jgi:hypothetical protein